VLRRALAGRGHDVVVLSRRPARLEPGVRHRVWDGRTLGDWASELDGAGAVINLAGLSVSCRYTDENLRQMMDSRVGSTQSVGEAIGRDEAQVPSNWDEAAEDLVRGQGPTGGGTRVVATARALP